jgi:hypothetical protein
MPASSEISTEQSSVNHSPTMQYQGDGSILVPAGEYVLGDPCYAVPHEEWGNFCDSLFSSDSGCIAYIKGRDCLSFRTAFGDGGYMGTDGAEYGVDSGMIGLVPITLPGVIFDGVYQTKVIFDLPTRCYTDGTSSGMLHFGDLTIDTVQDDDDEDCCHNCGR